jgi:polyhydroxyalkanoate synthesis regulator phasin
MTKEERLAEIRQRIDDLEAQARNGTPEVQERLQRRLDALLDDAEAAGAAIDEKTVLAEEKLFDLEARIDSTRKRVSAELSDDKESFTQAVEEELDDWNAAIERLQARAVVKASSARDQAETSVAELRKARNRAADRLAESRSSSSEGWEEQKQRVTAALDELEQKAREARAKLK